MNNEEFEKITSLEKEIVLSIAKIYNTTYYDVCNTGEKNIYCIYVNMIQEPICKIHASTEEIDEGDLKKKINIENSDYYFYELK